MVVPDSGFITFNGENIVHSWQHRRQLGYMPQIGRYPDNMTIGQVFSMMKDIRSENSGATDETLLEAFDLRSMFNKRMRTLSGGTRQKVSAALAFLFNPDVLILDEPTAGLDPLSSEILKEKIIAEKQKGKLILITSHVLTDLEEITTDVMYLQEGKEMFFKSLVELQKQTGEEKLSKIIAHMMKHGLQKKEAIYLKIAK